MAESAGQTAVSDRDKQTREWGMWLHFSVLLGSLTLVGYVVPFVIWQIKKEELPDLDVHGKIVMNWIISAFIYGVIFVILSIVLIGLPFLFALVLASFIYPVIGGIKANKGEVWRYPLSLRLLK